jgi:hypothetical protein
MSLKPLNSVGGFSVGNGTITTVIYPNTDVTTANLVVTNYANLGDIANVYIGGGTNGAVLSTDGTGVLSWSSSPGVTEIQNGNSNVSIPTTSGNIYINANAGTDYQWNFDTTGNLKLPGTLFFSDNSSNIQLNASESNALQIYGDTGLHLDSGFGSNVLVKPGINGNFNITSTNSSNSWVFDYNDNLTAPGNATANLGNLVTANYGNFVNDLVVQGNIANVNNISITNNLDGNTANFSGNIVSLNANLGNLVTANNFATNGTGGDITLTGGNVQGANVTFSNSFTSNGGTVDFNTNNANVQLGSNANVHLYGGNVGEVLQTDGAGNLNWYAISATGIQNGNSNVSIPVANGNIYINANAGTDYQWNFDTTGNLNIPQGGYVASGNAALELSDTSSVWLTPNVNADLTGLYMVDNGSAQLYAYSNVSIYSNEVGPQYEWNFDNTGNTQFPSIGTANLGNTVTANYFYANADANIAGNLTVQSNANIVGNLTAGNIIGIFANGTSNVAIPVVNGNINLSVGGNANVLTVAATGANVIGTFYANGNITTTSTFVGNTITSTGTYLTIASDQDANGTYNINLVPGGAGNVDVHSTNITSLADPVNPQDAATKQYVDNISQGLYVHPAANLLASSNLNATYNNGGTSLTVTDIIGNSVVQFSAAHGLTIGNSISFTNSFNGINGDPDVYYVASVPAPNQITLKDAYFGPSPVETLIAGSGLTQPALGSQGLGATLTNAGTNAALVVDSVTTTVGLRVLVTGQTTQAYNGVYDITTVGNVSTPWVMTRSTDGDQYIPQSSNGLCGGSYFFVTEGAVYGGSSWIVTTTGEIDIGVSNVAFVQFSQGGAYTGANGISVIGTQITANVDNVTTAIISGNITVAANAQLVTPNIGDATGTSLNLTGNLLAGNVNSNAATITDTLTVNTYANVGNLITVGYGNIGTDLIVGGNANITGNVQIGTGSGGNITGVNYISANYANIANDVTANGNVTALSGNIAADAFYGNSITINNGGNANITGNLTTNYIFANYDANISGNANVTLAINGNTANFSGNVFVGNSSSNVNITTDGNVTATGTVNAYDANVGNSITLGNTAVYWATVTTSTIAANQTVAQIPIANITGVEFFIKGVDQNGVANKYSAATVMAVTDGTNADFVIYGTTFIGATTGGLVVNIVGSNIALQVSPASTNSTVWTTQFRTI